MKNNDKVSGSTNHDSKIADSPNKPDVKKKIVVVPFQEPTRLYFSSPCLLSEIEDDEDILNQ